MNLSPTLFFNRLLLRAGVSPNTQPAAPSPRPSLAFEILSLNLENLRSHAQLITQPPSLIRYVIIEIALTTILARQQLRDQNPKLQFRKVICYSRMGFSLRNQYYIVMKSRNTLTATR